MMFLCSPWKKMSQMGGFLTFSMNVQKNESCDNVSKRNIQKDVCRELLVTKRGGKNLNV